MSLRFPAPESMLKRQIDIVLIGVGGTGSDMAVRLAKLDAQLRALDHPGLAVTMYDPDVVTETNIGRQHFPPSAIGLNKAVVLAHSLNLAYGLDWKAVPLLFDPVKTRFGRHSIATLLITCTDLAAFRAKFGLYGRQQTTNALWLDTGNGRDTGQVILGHWGMPTGGLRLPNVFDLYPQLADMAHIDRDEPSCSAAEAMRKQAWPVNQAAALLAVELLWTLITAGGLDYHGATFKLAPFRTTPMLIDPQAWEFYGYREKSKSKRK